MQIGQRESVSGNCKRGYLKSAQAAPPLTGQAKRAKPNGGFELNNFLLLGWTANQVAEDWKWF